VGHRRLTRHGLGATSALDKGYSPDCVEGLFSNFACRGFYELRLKALRDPSKRSRMRGGTGRTERG